MSPGSPVAPARRHTAVFHDGGHEFVSAVGHFVREGLERGEDVVVVATADRLAALEDELPADLRGSAGGGRGTRRHVAVESAEVLAASETDGRLDLDRFAAAVDRLLAPHGRARPVRVFGEVVSLLWDRGDVDDALRLERWWDRAHPGLVSVVLCGYPARAVTDGGLGDLREVCRVHDLLVPPHPRPPEAPDGTGENQRSEAFLPVPDAVAAARSFVTAVLIDWGQGELAGDAALVVSEMATNAVVHAASPFRAFVRRSGGTVLVAVKDAGLGSAVRHPASQEDMHGRGVAIVEAFSHRWGCEPLPEGKIVWAELVTEGHPGHDRIPAGPA